WRTRLSPNDGAGNTAARRCTALESFYRAAQAPGFTTSSSGLFLGEGEAGAGANSKHQIVNSRIRLRGSGSSTPWVALRIIERLVREALRSSDRGLLHSCAQ
ncbi:hypothetical protein K0M31_014069, partial [Melipona bicolor]